MAKLDYPNSARHCEGCKWGWIHEAPTHRRVAFESSLTKLDVERYQRGEEPTDGNSQVPVELIWRHGAAAACARQILSGECGLIAPNSDGQLEAKSPVTDEGKPNLRIVD